MDEDKRTVWCGNLSDRLTEELLYEFFLQAAPLERVHIPTDKEGRKSNFAFVTMKHEASVDYAVQLLNGTPLFDRRINIKPRGRNNQNNNANNSNNNSMQNRGHHDNNSFVQQQREPPLGNFQPPREQLDFGMTPQRGRVEHPQDFMSNSPAHRVQEANQDYGQVIHELLEFNNLLKFPNNSYDDMNRSFDNNSRLNQHHQSFEDRNHRRNNNDRHNNKPYNNSNSQYHNQNKRDNFNSRDKRRQQHNQGNNSRGFKEKGWRYRN